ncbi:DUF5916 domain-containing protein [Bacteroidota bacterium]
MGDKFSFLFALLVYIISQAGIISAQTMEITNDSLQISAYKIESEIYIDGILDESAWKSAAPIRQFTQKEPNDGEPVSERTELRIIYDHDNLYLGIKCWDTETQLIVANEMRRDNPLSNNDAVEIILDTYNDHRTAFSFVTNPLGAQRDGVITAGVDEDNQNWDWNGVWDCKSTIDSLGWTAEIKIPFKTLRFTAPDNNVWGLNVVRIIPRNREEAYWAPISRSLGFFGKYRLDVYGHLQITGEIAQPEKFQIKPFILTGIKRDFEEDDSYSTELEFGLDAKYLATSDLTLDLTLNTDFAQVEADQEQVNLTRFELFFPEKREFFLEGAGIFRVGDRVWSPMVPPNVLFFSRRIGLSEDNEIVPIYGGVKLSGKMSEFDVGILSMFTNQIDYINDDDEDVHIPRANFSTLRVKRGFGNSFIGAIALNKESLEDNGFNRTYAVDANIYINDQIQVGGYIAKSSSPDLGKKDLAFSGDIFYVDDLFTMRLSQNSIQEDFNPEMGYIQRTGIRSTNINLGLSPRPDFLNIRQTFLFNDFYYYAKQDGQLESRWNFTGTWTQFQDGSYLWLMLGQNYELLTEEFEVHDDIFIPVGIYKFSNFFGEYQTDLSKPVSGKANINVGNFYDGKILGFGFGSNLKLGYKLTLNLDYNHNKVKLPAGNFETNLLSARFLYTFSPAMYVKAFIQWNSDRDVILSNVLFNFIHTPGSDLYIVYNEEIETAGRKPASKNRMLLLKLTYLFSI